MTTKTWMPKAADIEHKWYVVDAEGQTLGRLATQVAQILRGKHKPTYTPHMDMGDYVIVVNAAKVHVTGNKEEQKIYYTHSRFPGGIKQRTLSEQRAKHPDRIVRAAVRGMLPKGTLGTAQLKKLKIFAGPEHPHQAQQPITLKIER
jgi:large subunit ribosomal protein L13